MLAVNVGCSIVVLNVYHATPIDGPLTGVCLISHVRRIARLGHSMIIDITLGRYRHLRLIGRLISISRLGPSILIAISDALSTITSTRDPVPHGGSTLIISGPARLDFAHEIVGLVEIRGVDGKIYIGFLLAQECVALINPFLEVFTGFVVSGLAFRFLVESGCLVDFIREFLSGVLYLLLPQFGFDHVDTVIRVGGLPVDLLGDLLGLMDFVLQGS